MADELVMLRQALKPVLELQGFTIVGEASGGEEAVELTRTHQPDVIVLDPFLARMKGIQTVRELHRACPSTRIIILTAAHDNRQVLEAVQNRVPAFIDKTQGITDLLWAIREVMRGGMYLGPNASKAVLQSGKAVRTFAMDGLSSREHQVLKLVAEGQTTKEIAAALSISVKTAAFHRARLMSKLDIHQTAGLVRFAIRHGFIVA